MTLIVENGIMPDGANTYAALVDADSYLIPRGLWPVTETTKDAETGETVPDAATVSKKESALIRATDYLNSLCWKGSPVEWRRTLAWPRSEVPMPGGRGTVPVDAVPSAVGIACMEMAAVVFGGGDPMAVVERGGMVTSESHSKTEGGVDVIGGDSVSDSYTYAANAPAETYYPQLRGIEPYLLSIPGKMRGVRVLEVARG